MNDMNTESVLVIEDEPALGRLVRDYLTREGFDVTVAMDGERGLQLARELDPAVIILDIGLPRIDGLEVCRSLRRFSDAYVLMLTARGDETDKIVGLSVGADDYLVKPFSPREVVARVRAMLRRPRRMPDGAGTDRTYGDLAIDLLGREVRIGEKEIDLTATEFDVLAVLARSPNVAFSRSQLIEAVWGAGWVGDERLVDVHVGRVRRKLGDDAGDPRYVRTVRGVGYRMGQG
ncbi:Two component transcriptional regulator, winged helix family OS=Tsukamurella paurometabola (strain ATCC 8368 / DSM / CCUG 35730 / CIP 100753 / JCM 10117/ KCTC 9821 / NBRC 16120 / NCIMB 702349 / NCTC 13040) OX=521096 GN=Tpau_0093 PE=4 SV=1 [Tsukamurella paurometabola]|uniref:Two component transcriptional regulator, winged helix family n=1 Tax=Tsukamurella paurometabola (strain ATCC 8368 / DSM 20162 / CCUG 35730 / CIP 100753 / JCM 10117 / KCTC 9821 / NBRC 16120 / NCIMB 702349 / NCTC 13040) TaxID=521096 RepID=D5UPX9_TSUPD|nr:two component transcriptional regulator, winged helix family [Tsukamurella paurometabola DSM 20162]SUP41459.1 Alkaline phosphatase synthesis transcriptional regulatory protein phoP [Tsukamurella paurometabola]